MAAAALIQLVLTFGLVSAYTCLSGRTSMLETKSSMSRSALLIHFPSDAAPSERNGWKQQGGLGCRHTPGRYGLEQISEDRGEGSRQGTEVIAAVPFTAIHHQFFMVLDGEQREPDSFLLARSSPLLPLSSRLLYCSRLQSGL